MSKKNAPRRPPTASPSEEPRPPRKGILREIRELWDTLVLAFVLVTLMKTFIVDLYKIPSGSMTPTLVGDTVAWRDFDSDGDDDLILFDFDPLRGDPLNRHFVARQVFLRGDDGALRCATDEHRTLRFQRSPLRVTRSEVALRYDRIFVNKMWYWFAPLRRGDIVVFKLPDREDPQLPGSGTSLFNPIAPFFIKRIAALEGETPTIDDQGHLVINGEIVSEPLIYAQNHYFNNQYNPILGVWYTLPFLGTTVPEGQFYVFGDNSGNSADSRFWGGVENDRVRGRAFFRYWPLRHIGFLH